MDNLNKKIKAVRIIRQLRQVDVAAKALFSIRTYQRIESGKKDLTEHEIARVAKALGCTSEELRLFDLGSVPAAPARQAAVETLLAENNRLRHLVNRLLSETGKSVGDK